MSIKKNQDLEYTPTTPTVRGVFDLVSRNTVPIIALLFAIVNMWLVTKLAPLAQDLALGLQRVEALEARTSGVENDVHDIKESVTDIKSDTSFIRGKLEGIK